MLPLILLDNDFHVLYFTSTNAVRRIYKDKYMDGADTTAGRGRDAKKDSEKKPREKSRTRLFSRKKSTMD